MGEVGSTWHFFKTMFFVDPMFKNIYIVNLYLSEKDLKIGWIYDTMSKAFKNPWRCWPFSLTNVWYIGYGPLYLIEASATWNSKASCFSQEPKAYYIEQTNPLRTVQRIFKIPYLDHKNILSLVCSTCLFLLGNNREKAWKYKSFDIPSIISERERSGSRWSVTPNKLEMNCHGWYAERICVNCWIISRKHI